MGTKTLEEKPLRIYDEDGDGWTDYGRDLARRINAAIKPIATECLEDGVDLRHAAFVAGQEVSTVFLMAFMKRRTGTDLKG